MGCASSSPLVGAIPGGLVENVKTTASDVMHTGENAMNEMGENITETVTQLKETMMESVNNVTNSIGDVIGNEMKRVPLKDTMDSANHMLDENMENIKNDMLSKAQSIGDDADKMTDQLIKDTEDVVRDAETGMVDMKNGAMDAIDSMKLDFIDDVTSKSPSHSIDSLKTTMPEPEIERILNGELDNPASPEATTNEMENLNNEAMEASMTMASHTDDLLAPSAPPTEDNEEFHIKNENDLVVEDVKSTDENQSTSINQSSLKIGKRLLKTKAVLDSDSDDSSSNSSSDDDFEFDVPAPIVPKPSIVEIIPKASKLTKWEELQAEINQMRMGNPPPRSESPDSQKSQKSLTRKNSRDSLHEEEEDDNGSALNLNKLYHQNSQKSYTSPNDDSTGDAIDELLKNIEDEMKVEDVEEE
ncbi:unnamed protein product [Diamesa serratosioi]